MAQYNVRYKHQLLLTTNGSNGLKNLQHHALAVPRKGRPARTYISLRPPSCHTGQAVSRPTVSLGNELFTSRGPDQLASNGRAQRSSESDCIGPDVTFDSAIDDASE